ncbi:MAG: hypothetical protein AB8G26_04850 [Ilumatobacter sp.]
MIRNLAAKALPIVATIALLIPAGRKLLNASWRETLGASYRFADRDVGANFFLLVGLLELAIAAAILWPRIRVAGGFVMAGFFVGALFFNLVLRLDQDQLSADQASLSTLIPLDTSHFILGLAVALLWRDRLRLTP